MKLYFLFLILILGLSASVLAQEKSAAEAQKKVTAEKGDGIYTLLRKNGLDPALYFKAFVALNQGSLGRDSSLYAGRSYLLPELAAAPPQVLTATTKPAAASAEKTSGSSPVSTPAPAEPVAAFLEVPLFGKNYSRVEVKDQQLKGTVYYLTSGHGGPDPGAIGKYGPYELGEDEYAYDVTVRLARRLMEHGATVYMIVQDENDGIRDENILPMDQDEVCHPKEAIPYSQKERLRQRTNAVNNLYIKHKGAYQRMLAIHVDSRSKGENIDVFFYHHENSPSGKRLADNIHQTIISKYNIHQPNRDYSGNVTTRSSLYVVKYSHPPAVFVELGNIRNDKDQRRFVLPDNRQALANWICDGIITDYTSR